MRNETKMKVAKMRILKWMCRVMRLEKLEMNK